MKLEGMGTYFNVCRGEEERRASQAAGKHNIGKVGRASACHVFIDNASHFGLHRSEALRPGGEHSATSSNSILKLIKSHIRGPRPWVAKLIQP